MRKYLCCVFLGLGLISLSKLALAAEEKDKEKVPLEQRYEDDEERSPLLRQPAVRHRYEVRSNRFELGLSTNFSLNRMLRHAILIGAKLEYHIVDWLSLGADVGYGFGLNTGLADELKDQFSTEEWTVFEKRFSDIQLAGDVRVSFTPFTGKIALFSAIFVGYDFYLFGGLGFAMTKNKGEGSDFQSTHTSGQVVTDDVDAANEGFRLGPSFGLGTHLFFTRFFSVGLEIRDLVFSDNQTGWDMTRGTTDEEKDVQDRLINGDDKKLSNHFFFGLNFTVYLPPAPSISE